MQCDKWRLNRCICLNFSRAAQTMAMVIFFLSKLLVSLWLDNIIIFLLLHIQLKRGRERENDNRKFSTLVSVELHEKKANWIKTTSKIGFHYLSITMKFGYMLDEAVSVVCIVCRYIHSSYKQFSCYWNWSEACQRGDEYEKIELMHSFIWRQLHWVAVFYHSISGLWYADSTFFPCKYLHIYSFFKRFKTQIKGWLKHFRCDFRSTTETSRFGENV